MSITKKGSATIYDPNGEIAGEKEALDFIHGKMDATDALKISDSLHKVYNDNVHTIYEYKIVDMGDGSYKYRQQHDIEKELNELGKDGWEIVPYDYGDMLILKRETYK